ncbi:hypothetical protein [Pontibacter harenae]|uniref:hypothetical protein n=1 Tax=Pontibacter harenae TaxID=2894083 RepID=UPI001E578457|nr:hypothetical protein [Pontibacter harenae]MCC9167906.1 hypothetical protein [Pontibacter harenae]
MKRIYFDNMRNGIWISILILALIFILIGTFEVFEFENPIMNKWISAIGCLLQVVYFTRIFWNKNYFQWNKKGAYIRINSFVGKTLRFDEIKTTELNEKKLTITKDNGNKVTFDLNDIAESDTQKVNEIIVKNTIANNL